jgi:recombination protein RecA
MSDTFDLIKKKLEKASKGNRMMVLSESEMANDVIYLPTDAYDLNRILSGSLYHGVASRTHTLLVGPEASGKSSFMCLNLASAQKMGYTPVIIDAEGAWTREFCERWGIDPSRAIIINTPWVEEIMVQLAEIIDEGWTKLAIAMDSIGAIESRKMINDGVDGDVKADQGGLQKKIKRLMKMIVDITKRQDSVSFSAGHYYGNPTGYGDPEKIGGGFYPRLAADYIITLKKTPIYENPKAKADARGAVLGTRIFAATIKNRYAPPFQEAVFEISYHEGVNKIAGIVDIAKEMNIIEQAGAWYTVPCLNMKVQGEANLYEEMEDEDITPMLSEIEQILSTRGYSSVNENLEALAESE